MALFALWSTLLLNVPVAGQEATRANPTPEPIFVVPKGPIPPQEVKVLGTPTFEDQVTEMVNQQRLANGGLPPLKRVSLLDISAEVHSAAMDVRNFFMHCDPDTGTNPADRMEAAGYINRVSSAENIAAGYASPADVIAGWMASSGHRANILNAGMTEIGVGYVLAASDQANIRFASSGCVPQMLNQGPFFRYWTQNFGRRFGIYPLIINREAFETNSPAVSLYLYTPPGATQMRFSNDNINWSSWTAFNNNAAWTLSSFNGTKTVFAQMLSGSTVHIASDTIELIGQDDNVILRDGFETGNTSSWQ